MAGKQEETNPGWSLNELQKANQLGLFCGRGWNFSHFQTELCHRSSLSLTTQPNLAYMPTIWNMKRKAFGWTIPPWLHKMADRNRPWVKQSRGADKWQLSWQSAQDGWLKWREEGPYSYLEEDFSVCSGLSFPHTQQLTFEMGHSLRHTNMFTKNPTYGKQKQKQTNKKTTPLILCPF